MNGDGSPRIILASGSPQRRELFDRLGIDYRSFVPGIEEIIHGDPREVVVANALLKARSGARPGLLTVGCDTEVVLEDLLFGKPEDPLRAHEYLAQLSGRTHVVLSGVAVIGPDGEEARTGVAETLVTLRSLTRGEIDAYVEAGEWRGRAGGYAIQGLGSALVESIEGDLSNVIGLPIPLLSDLAPELGLQFRGGSQEPGPGR